MLPLSRLYSSLVDGQPAELAPKGSVMASGYVQAVMSRIDDSTLANLEQQYASGLTSGDLIDVCAAHGIGLSEATLRKYVQLGLLPRSVRVGRKGKHKGSLGLYPARAIRQLVRIKEMMADDYTIEEIRRDFLFVRTDLDQLEQTLGCIFQTLARVLKQKRQETNTVRAAREVNQAKKQGRELVTQLTSIESLLSPRSRAAGGNVGAAAELNRANAS